MQQENQQPCISVVIPTCNRKKQLLSLLQNLNHSLYPLLEVIVVDSGEDRLMPADLAMFKNLCISYCNTEKSVCIQRNFGIEKAKGEWIFLCDDDIEVPDDYLLKLTGHIIEHKKAGAISGLVLQEFDNTWVGNYIVTSAFEIFWKYIFQLSIWGEIKCTHDNIFIRKIKQYYKHKGNHISKAGWPVVTDFSGDYFITPVYGIGASLVKREWLKQNPYEEVLDRHGIGDNYGVAVGFPSGIHVLKDAFVYHHQWPENRLQQPLQYLRRVLALDYFRRTKKNLRHIKKHWLLWSLAGNLVDFIFNSNRNMIKASFKSFWVIALNRNPYFKASKEKKKVIEPTINII